MSSKSYEESGYGLDLDVELDSANHLVLIMCCISKETWASWKD